MGFKELLLGFRLGVIGAGDKWDSDVWVNGVGVPADIGGIVARVKEGGGATVVVTDRWGKNRRELVVGRKRKG